MIFNFFFEAKYVYLELVLYPTGTVHMDIFFLCIKSLSFFFFFSPGFEPGKKAYPFLLFIAVVLD